MWKKRGFTPHLFWGKRKVNPFHLGKGGGFTLIELLVVIAIIGILSSIILVNLNAARDKAKNAAIKGALSGVRVAAEMWYDKNNMSYIGAEGVCKPGSDVLNDASGTDFARIKANIEGNGGSTTCYSSSSAYCAQSTLNEGGYWCVDSLGYSGATANCSGTNIKCEL